MIDAHHHIWLQKDLPWLLGPEQPRIFGPYGSIKRDYQIEEFQKDLKDTGVEKSVYVQANWAPNWFEDEVAWVQSVADKTGWPHGIVGFADFTVEDVRPQLDRLQKYPLMRGLRQQFHWHENPLYRFAQRPDLPADPRVRKNIRYLSDYDWSFDLQVFASQMDDAAGLAESCPDVQFVLMHAGMLEDTGPTGIKDWRKGMRRLAECENVFTKLSAFGTFIHRNDPEFIAFMIKQSVGLLGADRCMFGSNFPIEKLWTTYADLFGAFQEGAKGLTKAKRQAIFNDTAERFYRL